MREDLEPCRGLPGVRDVRVKGAIGVVQMANVLDATGLRARFVEKGVWIKPFSDVIYVTPPFTMEERELSRLTRAIVEVVQGR